MSQRFPLKRREVIALLLANQFQLVRAHGSHHRYEGVVDGVTRYVEVGHILAQLGFFDDARDVPPSVGWDRFYSGESGIARRAQLAYRPWDDAHWQHWYRR